MLREDILIVFLAPVALTLFSRMPKNPRVLGGIPIAVLAAVPVVIYACHGRHLLMIDLGLIYFCWIYLDAFIRAETQFGASPQSFTELAYGSYFFEPSRRRRR